MQGYGRTGVREGYGEKYNGVEESGESGVKQGKANILEVKEERRQVQQATKKRRINEGQSVICFV